MKTARNQQIEELFHAALELGPEERAGLFANVDPDIRREAESLLACHVDDASLSPPPLAAELLAGEAHPSHIGQYRILSKLGEGGMGVVYEAEQDRPRRIVALKIVRPGWCNAELQTRFERESQALGRLHHPGIAQIYEAGTADSGFGPQPYFAMELIRGSPLGQYADAKHLAMRDRLELVARICDAVQHAHQRGIIHRDLKPGNILVDETGQPKILDFGVARITDSDAHATRRTDVGQIVGTLAYMSPEQVLADPLELDTRSDVYALGVILYELLAGRLPYKLSKQIHEATRTIRETDPERLSAVNRDYRGDIETIVAKALEKDKNRRYNSAAELARDIRRHLDDEPVAARPPSASYQIQKFARRNRALVAGASTVFVVLLAGIVVSTLLALRADRAGRAALLERDRAAAAERESRTERDRALVAEQAGAAERNHAVEERNRALAEKRRADDEAATAQAVRDFLQNDLLAQATAIGQAGPGGKPGPDVKPDPDLKVRTALDHAAAHISGKFETRPLVEAAIRQTIATAYKELSLYPEAQRHVERAVELRKREQSENHPATLSALSELADVHMHRGRYADAEALYARLVEARSRLLGNDHQDTLESMEGLGAALDRLGKYADAEAARARLLAILRRKHGEDHPDTADAMGMLALVYTHEGKHAEAEPLDVRALEILQRSLGKEHPRTLIMKNNLAQVYRRQSKYAQSAALQSEVVAAELRLFGDESDRAMTTMANLGTVYVFMGKFAEGEALLAKAVSVLRRVLGEEHANTLTALNDLAAAYSRQGKLSQAAETYSETLEKRRRTLGDDHPMTLATMHNLAMIHRRQSRYAEAEVLLAKALDGERRSLGIEAIATLEEMILLSETRMLQQNYDVQALLREAISTLGRQNPENWMLPYANVLLGAALSAQGQYVDAERLLLDGYEGLNRKKSAIPPSGRIVFERSGGWIVQLYREWDKPDQVREWQAKLEREASATATAAK